MHAVRTDDRVGDSRCTVGEAQAYARADLIQSDQFMTEPDAFVRYGAGERGMQVAAMGEQIGRSELALGAFTENHVELDFACAPVPVVPGTGIKRLGAQSLLEPKLAQNFHGVAADLNAGAYSRKLRRLFVDGDFDADTAQRGRGGESAHAGADDR